MLPPSANDDAGGPWTYAMAIRCYQHVRSKGKLSEECVNSQQLRLEYDAHTREGTSTTHGDPDLPFNLPCLVT